MDGKRYKELCEIVIDYCEDFNKKLSDNGCKKAIVKDSIPIIWFGDIEEYCNSGKKVVTVGLNPSWHEFLEDENKKLQHPRFQKIDLQYINDTKISTVIKTLNDYYDGVNANPFMEYFNQYEDLLHSADASYFAKRYSNTAIHIDAYSAIATLPKWGELDNKTKEKFKLNGKELYDKFIKFLNPDVILISVDNNTFTSLYGDWIPLEENKIKKGIYINVYKRSQAKDKIQLVFHGRNFHGTPFGGMARKTSKAIIKRNIDNYIKITVRACFG